MSEAQQLTPIVQGIPYNTVGIILVLSVVLSKLVDLVSYLIKKRWGKPIVYVTEGEMRICRENMSKMIKENKEGLEKAKENWNHVTERRENQIVPREIIVDMKKDIEALQERINNDVVPLRVFESRLNTIETLVMEIHKHILKGK